MMVEKSSALKGTLFVAFSNEVVAIIHDMLWALLLIVVLILVDFWWGRRENHLHYVDAKKRRSRTGIKMHEFRMSRAIRRTANKVVDYVSLVILGAVGGMAITEPLNIATPMQMASIGAALAMIIESMSIWGHIVVVKRLTGQNLGVIGTIISKLVRSKSNDLADAIEEISKDKE